MNESQAREVVLLRAFEEPITLPWTEVDRAWASFEAARLEGQQAAPAALVARRGAVGVQRLSAREPAIAELLVPLGQSRWPLVAVLAVAAVAGFMLDAVGSGGRINILALPLIALLAWNLVVYALLALHAVGGIGRERPDTPGPLRRVVDNLLRQRRVQALQSAMTQVRRAPMQRFISHWARVRRPLDSARLAAVLHAAAAVFAAAALASLYLRGLAFEYRASWDSTFLGADAVHTVLTVLLGPAALLSGIDLPSIDELATLRGASNGENAARWIHLQALTVGLVVLLPRGVLAALAHRRARRLSADFPLPLVDAYYENLLSLNDREPMTVHVLPYSYSIAAKGMRGLKTVIDRGLGPRVNMHVAGTIQQGQERDDNALRLPGQPTRITTVALFALAATPELETHGAFLKALAERKPAATRRVVMIDESGFRQRLASGDVAARVAQRRNAWRRMLQDQGETPVFVDLLQPDIDAAEADLQRIARHPAA